MYLKLISLVIILFSCNNENKVDKLYYNGIIWTGDKIIPYASAIAVSGEHIVFVGTDEDALNFIGHNTIKIDLKKKFITPGFIDSHVHLLSGGLQLSRLDLSDVNNKEEFQRRIESADKELKKSKWIVGGNWDHEKWGGKYPDKSWIDEIVADRPILLDRLDGHMSLANSRALEIAGINEQTRNPIGGIIQKDDNGLPTGILKENAIELCRMHIPNESQEDLDIALEKAMDYAISLGITQVHDMGYSQDSNPLRDLEVYMRNHIRNKLKIRIKRYSWYLGWKDLIKYIDNNGIGDDWLRWDGIKAMIDGSLGSKTAWMNKPYLVDNEHLSKKHTSSFGILALEDTAAFKNILINTDKANIQHAVHAIGDQANDWILNKYTNIMESNGFKDRRSRVEHAQHLSEEAISRFSKEKIIPSMQPYHLFDDGSWAHKRVGYDILSRTYVFRSLIDSGANLAFGSDWTVASLNPMTGIYAAVTRRTRDKKNQDGWFPNEKISVEDALKCYTTNNAYAAFWEDKTGSITVGKYADFLVHSKNLLTIDHNDLLESRILRTVVGGTDYIFE